MTVKDYIVNNPNKAAYTIRKGKTDYLCTNFEANSFFGSEEVKEVTFKYDSEQLPLLQLKRKRKSKKAQ